MESRLTLIAMVLIVEFILLLFSINLLKISTSNSEIFSLLIIKGIRAFVWLLIGVFELYDFRILGLLTALILNFIYCYEFFSIFSFISKRRFINPRIVMLISLVYAGFELYYFTLGEFYIVSTLHSEWLLTVFLLMVISSIITDLKSKKYIFVVLALLLGLIPQAYRYYLVFTGVQFDSPFLFLTVIPSVFFPFLMVTSITSYLIIAVNIRRKLVYVVRSAHYDFLTLAKNRRSFWQDFEVYVSSKDSFGFAIIDIDDFKSINDLYGHPTGDYILQKVSSTIIDNLPESSIFGRIGGEEFAILIPSESQTFIFTAIDEIRKQINNILITDDLKTSVSIGLVINNLSKSTTTDLYNIADDNLYTSKKNGKNQTTTSII